MSLFDRIPMGGGTMDVIRCDEQEYLVWQWHPKNTIAGKNRRESSIRLGSSLHVRAGSVAVFVGHGKDGTFQDFIEGPFDGFLSTQNIPVISRIYGLVYNGESPFVAEVYFINLARVIQMRFGVPYFDVFDYRYEDLGVPVAVRGTITFRIADYKDFVKIHRLESFAMNSFSLQVSDAVSKYIKTVVANETIEKKIPMVQLERNVAEIGAKVETLIIERFSKDFGVLVSGVDISSIDIDKTSQNYQQLKALTHDITAATVKARTEAELKTIAEMQRINMEHLQESKRIEREEGQYARHMETRTANINAYQIEKQADVGVAGANALGQMGANGAGSVNLGDSSGGVGFNPAAMMASMAVGSVVGQNIAGAMKTSMDSTLPTQMPPPILSSVISYNVAIEGKPEGPFDISALSQMARTGKITKDSLVWKPGMSNWMPIYTVIELAEVVNAIPPTLE